MSSLRKTTEEFIQELHLKNEHYRNGEFEVVSEYISQTNKLILKTEYGLHSLNPTDLFRDEMPSLKSCIDKNSYVKNLFSKVHGDIFDYSKVEYVKAKLPLIIGCKVHGDFPQSYDTHRKGHGCPKCASDALITQPDEIRRRLNEIEPNSQFDLTNVRVQEDHMGVICQYSHEYKQRVKDKLHSHNGCPVCASIMQSFTYELSGNQLKDAHKIPRILYVLHFNMGKESFFKVGATRDIDKRIKDIRRDAKYNIKVISVLHTNAMIANTMEDYFLTSYKHLQYTPLKYFGGYTECFSIDVVRWEWNERGHWYEYKLEQDRLWCEEHGLDFEQNYCHYYLS